MRSDAPPLLPILRSRTQAGVLAVLLLNPGLELSLTELADRLGAPLTSVVDEVKRLEPAGILASRSVGRTRLIRVGDWWWSRMPGWTGNLSTPRLTARRGGWVDRSIRAW